MTVRRDVGHRSYVEETRGCEGTNSDEASVVLPSPLPHVLGRTDPVSRRDGR